MLENKETCCFMHLIYRFLHDERYYFLHVKEHEKINPKKILLGYYDNAYVYIIPSVLIGAIDNLTFQAGIKKLNTQKIFKQLVITNLIKVHKISNGEVRYRPEKRIGKTKYRYITFYKERLLNFVPEEVFR